MMWKLLILTGCLVTSGLARPDVSHLLKRTGADKQKRQSFIGTSVSVTGNGAVATEIKSGDGAAAVEAFIPQISLLPLQDNQPSPFKRLEERVGYDYQKPDFPLDVHPDSNLVNPVSTQAPEYLPPEDGQESSNVDQVAPSSSPSTTTTSTTTTTTTTTTTPAPTTTTTTPAPQTNGPSTTEQLFDEDEGYGYKKPEVMLPTNINEVIGEPSDINQLATTTVPTTTTTAKNSLEYLPPKPLPELVVPKEPSSTPSTTQQPPQTEPSTYPTSPSSTITTTAYQVQTETQPPYSKLPEASVYPDASGSVSTVVTQQTPSTEIPSTSAPEYLPPDSEMNGFQIIVRTGSDSDDSDTTSTTTGSSEGSSSTTTVVVQSFDSTTTAAPVQPEADSQVREEQPDQSTTTTEGQTTTAASSPSSSVPLFTDETVAPVDDASSVIEMINQMQETSQVAGQADFVPELRVDDEPATTSELTTVPSFASSVTTIVPSQAATDLSAVEPTERSEPEQQPEATTGPSLIDLLTPTATIVAVQNDTIITTYRPALSSGETTTLVSESSADETEIQSRIADPNDGYNYEAPENGLTVPAGSSVPPSHTLEADGYHYKVPAVPFP
ncbi:cell wall protein DAN4-like [Anopheles merus]|nr:cell wall protein DAN4-like [Anopheles merus]XP_041773944.1 cell wall protein DAN4-like [Anopheles merus]